jgi:hypothetical protein
MCKALGSTGKGREGKGREGKGREGKGREGKRREGKGRASSPQESPWETLEDMIAESLSKVKQLFHPTLRLREGN